MADTDLTGGGADLSTPGTDAATSGAVAEPQPLDISDDTLIRVKGIDKPVKYGEHVRGFQGQWTKAAQKAADLERQLAERNARLVALEQAQQQAQAGTQQRGTEDALAALKQLPYLSGEQAAQVVVGIANQIRQRDQLLGATLQQLKRMEGIVTQLNQTHSNSSFDAKINKWLQSGGYPAEAAELAKEIYLAYEGDDLDDEFPKIFESRWKQIQSIIEGQRRAAVQAAKKAPFLPGKGGKTGPSAPLQMKGSESPRDVADKIWEAMNAGVET